jgi:hypothetical protein
MAETALSRTLVASGIFLSINVLTLLLNMAVVSICRSAEGMVCGVVCGLGWYEEVDGEI